jgi:hypothetical protein
MVCPNCNSTDLKKLSLIYAAGASESRGRILGFFVGSGNGLLFGKYTGTSQSRLSKTAAPPGKLPFATPTILWLLGFFVVMAFAGRGRLSTLMAIVSAFYLFLLPAYVIGALFYNFLVRPKKHKAWEKEFLCQRCGTVVASMACPNDTVPSRV